MLRIEQQQELEEPIEFLLHKQFFFCFVLNNFRFFRCVCFCYFSASHIYLFNLFNFAIFWILTHFSAAVVVVVFLIREPLRAVEKFKKSREERELSA